MPLRRSGGVARRLLYDNMKTVVLERDVDGPGEHRYHAGFLDYAKHCGFVIKLCRPYRARTKGKVERFNGYLRRSFYVPLVSRLKQAGLVLDAVTANAEVRRWLKEVANVRIMARTGSRR
jgi:transposase